MAEHLEAVAISSTLRADREFSLNPGLLVAQPSRCFNPFLPILVIPEGFYALVTSFGAEILTSAGSCVWPSGAMLASPFTVCSHLVTKQFVVFNAPVKGCKTKDNVQVNIDVSVVFRIMGDAKRGENPEFVRKFVHDVTPAGLEQQLKDALAQELRTLARSMAHTQVYACRTGAPPAPAVNADDDYDYDDEGKGKVKGPAEAKFDATAVQASAVPTAAYHGIDVTEAMKERLNEGFERQGISIHDISIMDVQLPHLIAQQMTNRTLVRSKQTYEKMEQKFLMQTIRLQNEVAQMKLDETEKQEKARTVGGKDTQSLRDGLNEKRAAYDRISAEFQEQTRADVSKIKARTQEMSGELDFKRERLLETLALEAQETATLTVARIEAHVEALVAETRAAVATLQGEAQTKLAAAEEAADALLSMARSLDLVEKRLDVYEALAANMDVVVSDSSDGEYNKLLLSDAVLRTHLEGANLTEAQLVAKLNVLRLASNAFGLRNEWTNR